jgi:quercetin dioxygenase-like cupin family protein
VYGEFTGTAGEVGCSIVEKKPLPPTSVKEPVFWHIGSWWLMQVGPETDDHHGGEHVAPVKLSPLPAAASYSMLVISAYIPAGMTSRVHFHSGVKAFYTVDGEQCWETAERAFRMKQGDTLVVPTGVTMRLVATGDKTSPSVRSDRI